jgi:hypothetical protein
MKFQSSKSPLALAALAALGAAALSTVPFGASAAGKTAGHYVTGDFLRRHDLDAEAGEEVD